MAKRRSLWAKAAQGLGEGIGDASSYLLRQRMQEKMQDRYDDRQFKNATLVTDRQQAAATQKQIDDILDAVMKGDTDAQQGAKRIALLTGKEPPASLLAELRPGPSRRLDKRFGEEMKTATSAETLPTEGDILSFARSDRMDVPGQVGFRMTEPDGFETMEPDPLGSLDPSVRETVGNLSARRRAFREKPTERIDSVNPITDAKELSFRSPYDYTEPTSIGPTAEQAGAHAGTKIVTGLEVSGGALADQAGKEAKAKQDVEMAPGAIDARVREAGRRGEATETGSINARTKNATQIIDLETRKALAALQTSATDVEFKAWGEQIAKAREAANGAIPILGQLRDLWTRAQPEIAALSKTIPVGTRELGAQIAQGIMPRGTLPTNVRKYMDLLEAARPRLARAMGNVGNFTEGEQVRAGFVAPDFLDAMNGGVTGINKLDRMEALFLAAPMIAQKSRPGTIVTGDDVTAIVEQYMKRVQPGDVPLPVPEYDILLTPEQPRRPGGR